MKSEMPSYGHEKISSKKPHNSQKILRVYLKMKKSNFCGETTVTHQYLCKLIEWMNKSRMPQIVNQI